MGYIRVRDFAAENNCTPQNIYKHLRNPNYAAALEGHTITGPGKQGLLLDDDAQAFLRSVMYPKAVTVDNEAMAEELAQMRAAMMKLGQENLKLAAELATTQGKLDRATLEAGEHQRLLLAAQSIQEAQAAELEQAKADVAAMTETARDAKQEAATARQEADQLHLELEKERAAHQAAEAQNAALKSRGLLARILRKGE